MIGGFTPGSNGIDELVVGYDEGRTLMYAARVDAINDMGRADFGGIKSRNQSSTSVQKINSKARKTPPLVFEICAPSPHFSFS